MHYQKIRELRTDQDLTQKELARLLQCSQQTYSDYERGTTTIPPEVLIRLADYYEISVDYLLGRSNER